jgi:broad specificity phosphatase PhoE
MSYSRILPLLMLGLALFSCGENDSEGTATIYLVRHGQTKANVDDVLAGSLMDSPLTEAGIESAKKLGQTLKSISVSSAYCSNLDRTYFTAKHVLEQGTSDITIQRMVGLNDVSYGEATGMKGEEAAKRFGSVAFPEAFGPIDDPDFFTTFHGENTYSWFHRFDNAINEIAESNLGKTALVVSHGACFLWGRITFQQEDLGFSNGHYCELKYHSGSWKMVSWNKEA